MELSEIEVSDKKAKQFNSKDINSVSDLVYYYPKGYIDYREVKTLDDAEIGEKCSIVVKVEDVRTQDYMTTLKSGASKKNNVITAYCTEINSLINIKITWFNKGYLYSDIYSKKNKEVAVSGMLGFDERYGYCISNPEKFSEDKDSVFCIKPVYSSIQGMSYDYLKDKINTALLVYPYEENISDSERKHFDIITEEEMLNKIHNPKTETDVYEAKKRITFDLLYEVAKKLSKTEKSSSNLKISRLTNFNKTIKNLSYELTEDQKNTILSLINKTRNNEEIEALIQGDVGCGKTICAFLMMIAMSDNGYQSVLMTPTGVLAKQHYDNLVELTEGFGLKTVFLAGGLTASKRKKVLKEIADGSADFIISTHSAISDDVTFNNLGLVVIDEEHKFGVDQKEKLRGKANEGVHFISLSATPIPRSLSLALSEDGMDIYSIYTMPNGRKPIKTTVTNNFSSVYKFMLNEISKGHKCYIVCPLIEEKEDLDEGVYSVETIFEETSNFFADKDINVGMVSGRLKEEEKEKVLDEFKNGDIQVLVSTTVIEVGVDVGEATVITIMNAERFGLATLHQLRGRVGRSSLQSYCILFSDADFNERLNTMVKSNDGFNLAEADLKMRGAGEILGVKQSGKSEEMEMMLKYPKLYNEIKVHIKEELL